MYQVWLSETKVRKSLRLGNPFVSTVVVYKSVMIEVKAN